MPVLTSPPLIGGAGKPVTGRVAVSPTAPYVLADGKPVTTAPQAGVIRGGEFFDLESNTPLELMPTPEGIGMRIVLEISEHGASRGEHRVSRVVAVPDVPTVAWADLVDVIPPVSDGDYIVPPWAATVLEARDEAVAAAQEAQAVGVANDPHIASLLSSGVESKAALVAGVNDEQENRLGLVIVRGDLTIEKLQTAANTAASTGRMLWAAGTLTASSTLTLACDADLGGLTINYTGTTVAVVVGATGSTLLRKRLVLPKLYCKTNIDAGAWGATPIVGVRLVNLNTCYVTSFLTHFFDEGMVLEGSSGGFAYTEVHPGWLSGNRKNLILRSLSGGWVNQNTIVGGRLSPNMTFGVLDDPQGRGLLIEDGVNVAPPNNNTFIGTSFESPNRDLYRVDVAGTHNYWLNCRWESPDPVNAPVRIRWRALATDNKIEEGYDLDKLVEVFETGSSSNRIQLGTGVLYHRAWAVTTQTFPNGSVETPITSWAQLNQKGSTYNAATGEITPRQGYWRFRAFVHVNALPGVAGFVQFGVRLNGVTQGTHRIAANSSQMQKLEVEFEGYFSGTDKLQYVISQNTVGDVTLTTSTRFCQFRGDYLS